MVISGVFLILLVTGMKYEERKIHNLLCSFLLPRRILWPPWAFMLLLREIIDKN